jgi:hypothetical protein
VWRITLGSAEIRNVRHEGDNRQNFVLREDHMRGERAPVATCPCADALCSGLRLGDVPSPFQKHRL